MTPSIGDRGRDAREAPVAVVTALAVASLLHAGLAWTLVGWDAPPAPLRVAWWILVPMFVIAEILKVKIPVQGTAITITTVHLPLVIGLGLTAPTVLMGTRLAGTWTSIAGRDADRPRELIGAAITPPLATLAAVAAYHVVLGGRPPSHPVGWIAAGVAVAAAVAAAFPIRRLVVSRRGTASRRPHPKAFLASGLVGLGGAAGGAAAVVILSADPWTGWLIAALAVPSSIALWAFGGLASRYEDLNSLFAFTRAISAPRSVADSVVAILTEVRLLFGVDTAAVAVFLDAPGEAEVLALGPGEKAMHSQMISAGHLAAALGELPPDGEGSILDGATLPGVSAATRTLLRSGLAASISRDGEPVGLIVAGNTGGRRAPDTHEARLFGAIVKHAALTLERSRLIERLTVEIADRRHEALHDRLTDLPNRTFFTAEIGKALAEPGATVAVLFVDLDHFKEINDTLGHDRGDHLLREVADRLGATVRPADFIARLGGDEFGVLVRVGSVVDAIGIARRIEESLRRPFFESGIAIEVGASIGIALADGDTMRPSTMLQHADIAMYTAKRAGTVYEVYSPDQQHYSPARLALAGELRAAIGEGDLGVHFQPQVEIATGRVVGAEALARWTHPVRGPIPPGEFVPIAEKTGLIRLLTSRVLRESLQAAVRWPGGNHSLAVAVNLSPRILHDPGFTSMVSDLLRMTDMNPRLLTFEITESTVMHDAPKSRAALEHLAGLGVSISIDDFGTGYSSLAAIRELPLHELKVDRTFVIAMDTDPGAAAIVSSTIALAHRLGLRVVAEGVETERSLEMLAEMGCDVAQGYYLGRPMPEPQLMRWLDEWGSGRAASPVVALRTAEAAHRRRSGA